MSKSLSEDSTPTASPVEAESVGYKSYSSEASRDTSNDNVKAYAESERPIADAGNYGAPTNEGMDVEPVADTEIGDEIAPVSNSDVRGISINPLSSGYMVKVGCQSVAVESTETLIKMLDKYLSDPDDFERKWYSKNVRNRLTNIL